MPTGNSQGFYGAQSGHGPAQPMMQQRGARSFAPAQGQPFQRPGMSLRGGMAPMQRAAPMAARPTQPMEPRSAQLGGGSPMGMGGRGAPGAGPAGGMAGRVAGMFGGGGGGTQMPKMPPMGMGGALMSDERSKEKIQELEGIKQRYLALIDGDDEGGGDGFESVGSHEFSYKPEFQDKPGAGRGRFAGPMTSELKGIPGVVKDGPEGMEQVDTPRLTMANASQIGNLTRDKADRGELDELRARLAALSDDPDATLDVAGGRRR